MAFKLLDHIMIGFYTDDQTRDIEIEERDMDACFITNFEVNTSFNGRKNWSSSLYGSEDILTKIQSNFKWQHELDTKAHILKENEPISFQTSNGVHYKVTMLNLSNSQNNCHSYLFEALGVNVTHLLTTRIDNFFDQIMCNRLLQEAIQNTIDFLYIDDSVFTRCNDTVDLMHRNELRFLVKLVRPRNVIGIYGTDLPLYIKDLCQKPDFYTDFGIDR